MKPFKVTITHYTKSQIASIQYGEDPASYNYLLYSNGQGNPQGFALELIRLIGVGAIIEIETLEFKL